MLSESGREERVRVLAARQPRGRHGLGPAEREVREAISSDSPVTGAAKSEAREAGAVTQPMASNAALPTRLGLRYPPELMGRGPGWLRPTAACSGGGPSADQANSQRAPQFPSSLPASPLRVELDRVSNRASEGEHPGGAAAPPHSRSMRKGEAWPANPGRSTTVPKSQCQHQ